MTVQTVPTYIVADTMTIQFFRVKNVPGFTHRVVINGRAAGWLADTHKPSAKTAVFFATEAAAA